MAKKGESEEGAEFEKQPEEKIKRPSGPQVIDITEFCILRNIMRYSNGFSTYCRMTKQAGMKTLEQWDQVLEKFWKYS